MLYFIGLGLGNEKDITVAGKEAIERCSHVFLDAYTSLLPGVKHELLENFHAKKIVLAYRDVVESDDNEILKKAETLDVAFLVVGDPFGATTHTDLVLRAQKRGIAHRVIHNASIMNAIGCTGLQLYNFGMTVSIVTFTDSWKPESWYDYIIKNKSLGLHTLCLLDIQVREQSVDDMIRGIPRYLPPKFMTVGQAALQIIELEERRSLEKREKNESTCDPIHTCFHFSPRSLEKREKNESTCESDHTTNVPLAIGVARVGSSDQQIVVGTLQELAEVNMGEPLHSLVIPGNLHELERDYLRIFALNMESFDKATMELMA